MLIVCMGCLIIWRGEVFSCRWVRYRRVIYFPKEIALFLHRQDFTRRTLVRHVHTAVWCVGCLHRILEICANRFLQRFCGACGIRECLGECPCLPCV